MAKAGKLAGEGGQPASHNGFAQDGVVPKPARKPRAKASAPAPVPGEASPPVSAESPSAVPAVPVAPAPVGPVVPPDLPDSSGAHFQDALAEVRAVREQVRAARDETVAALNQVRAEAAAAATEVAQIKHLCKQTAERLIAELGEQSLALTRVRQASAEGTELARAAEGTRAELRTFRSDCDATGKTLDALADQTRTAYREVFAEATDGVRRLLEEIDALRLRVVGNRQGLEPPAAGEETAETGTPKNRFGASVVSAAVVASVFEHSPAATAGIKPGDVIEEAQGHALQSGGQLRERIAATPAGEDLTLQLRRGGETLLRTVHLGDAKATGEAGGRFGVTVESAVVVAEVFAGSPAAAAGLLTGDVIEDAHGQPVQSGEQLLTVIHAQPEGAEVVLVVSRAGERYELVAHLDRA